MAVSAVAGLVSAVSAAAAAKGVAFFTALFGATGATAFLIGSGLSALSRALTPKPKLGAAMRGLTQTTKDPAGSRKLIYGQIRAGGQVVFIGNSGADNKFLHLVVVFATHEIESFEQFYFNDKLVYTNNAVVSAYSSHLTITKFDGSQTTADSTLVSTFTLWTANHKLNDLAYAHFKLEWDADIYPNGVPNISAVMKGKKVFAPRDSNQSVTDPSTWTYSRNPALCSRDYLVSAFGLDEDHALIDTTALTAAANVCDQSINLIGGGTQNRYELNGMIDTGNQIKDNIEQMLGSMAGRLTYSGGKYFVSAAGYVSPNLTFSEADAVAPIQVVTKQTRRNSYNSVKGIFVSEEKNYKVLDYPVQTLKTEAGSFETGKAYQILFVGTTDFTAIGASSNTVGVQFTATGAGSGTGTASSSIVDDGAKIALDMPLPFVTNHTQAQRIAKIALLKSRQQTVITMTVNLKGLRVKVGDTIYVSNTHLGYTNKIFEVIDYSLAMADGGNIAVSLTCIETASSIYDWTTASESDFLSGGTLTLYDGLTVNNVTSLNATEIGLRGPDGALKSAVQLSWTPPTDAFVELFTVRYNKNGTTDYFETQTREANLLIEGLDKGSNYDFRVKAQNLLGVQSTGTSTNNFALTGDTTAPGQASSVNLTAGINQITAEWTNPTDIDLAFIEVFVKTTNSTPGTNDTPTAKVNGTEYIATGLSSATRHFFLRSVDFSGNKSAFVSGGSATSVLAGSGDIDGDEVLHEIPVGDLAHYWPCNSISNLGSGEEKLQEVIAGKTGVHSGGTAPTITTDSPSGKSVKISPNSGFTLLNDTDADALETSAGFAWSFWFKSETTSGVSLARIITRDASDGWAVLIDQSASGNQTITLYGEPGTESMGSVAVNEWHHFAFSENGSGTLSGYVNGELVSTESYTPVVSSRPVVIGCNTESNIQPASNPFDGKLTEIRAYSRALTKQEVRGLYKNPVGSLPAELDGDLIVDGSITATQIAADTITATQIAADTITATELATDSVTTTEINVSNLAGISADAGTITGGSIGGVTITSTKLHQGTGTFANSNTGFYLDNTGQFSLKDKLTFNGTLLNVDGDIKANNLNVQDATVFGTLTATDLADGIVKNASISQEVWNEIESRFGTSASSGFFEEVTGNITGGDLSLATTSAKSHAAGETVYFEADINHAWSAAFQESGDDLKIDIKFQHDTDSSFSSPTTVHTQQLTVTVSQFFIGFLYQLTASVQFQLTGLAAGNYFFRVSLEPVGSSPNAFSIAATPPSAGVPATFQVNEVGSGTLSSGVNADQLDGIDSTGFFRLGSSSSSINNVAYGNLTITGNLTVQGSQTSLEVATLQVQDKNVVLNYSTGDSSGSADGAGITIQDAVNSSTDATILWSTSNDRFEFSHNIKLPGTGQILAGTNGYIDFDDDSTTFTPGSNATVVASVSDVAIRTNTNDGGGGQFTVVTGNSSPSTMLSITTGGNATFAGSVTASSFTTTGDINFGDDDKAVFGAGSDLQIYHDGSHSYIEDAAGTGNLKLRTNTLRIENAAGTELSATFVQNGAVSLYNDNSIKLATTSTGIDVTGVITTDGMTTSADINFGDDDKANFGASNDLQIFHESSTGRSFIKETGSDEFRILASNIRIKNGNDSKTYMQMTDGGSVAIRHNDATKLETSSTGVNITGTLSADALTISGDLTFTNINVTGTYSMDGTVLVDASRNLKPASVDNGDGTSSKPSYSFESDSDTGFYRPAADTLAFLVGGSEMSRFTASGIGINQSTVNNMLHVRTTTNGEGITIQRDSTTETTYGQLSFLVSTNDVGNPNLWIRGYRGSSFSTSFLTFGTANIERVRMDQVGNLLVGRTTNLTSQINSISSNTVVSAHGDLAAHQTSAVVLQFNPASNMGMLRAYGATAGTGGLRFNVGGGGGNADFEAMRISEVGAVGIGTTSPLTASGYANLTLNGNTGGQLHFTDNDVRKATIASAVDDFFVQSVGQTIFRNGGFTSSDETARIDSSGNFLVGTTDTSPVSNNAAGAGLFSNGSAQFSRDSNVPVFVNRKTNDGTLINLRKDGTTIGTIAVSSSDNLSIGGSTADHAGLLFGTHVIYPLEAGSLANGTIQLGDANYRLKNIYLDALNISSNASNDISITATDTAPDTAFNAMKLDYNISGSGATTGDRNHIGFFIDVDSSATGGDVSDEHRVYGIFNDVRVSGDSDLIYGIHSVARVDNFGSSNQVTNLRAINGVANSHQDAGRAVTSIGALGQSTNNTSGSGQVDHTYGLYGIALAQSTSSYNSGGYSGVFGIAQVTGTQTANINNVNGVRAEIQLDNKTTSAITISNAYVVRAEYDENDSDDASYTVTNGYLFYGNYAGTLPSTAYGVYIQDAVRNYFGGFLTAGVGSASAPSYAFNGDTDTGMFRPSAGNLGFSTNGAEEMRLTSGGNLHVDGNITAFSTTVSDQRLKIRVEKIKNAVDKVKQIDGVSFVRTTNGEKSAGIIAQQIIDVLPEAVKKQTLPLQTGDEETEYYVVEYDAVTGLLVSAINELIQRVEDLENGDK